MSAEMPLTGVNLPPSHELTALHWFNLPGFPSKESTLQNEFLLALQRITELPLDQPLFLYMANSYIDDFDMITHPDEQDQQILNAKGVHIYLYEPICPYDSAVSGVRASPQQQGSQFYIDLPASIPLQNMRAVELDAIKVYCDRNRLTNVTVHSCDYNIDKYFPYYQSSMKLTCDDLFLRSQTVYNNVSDQMSDSFTHKFICTNWRYTKHRNLIAAYLVDKSAHLSWNFNTSLDVIQDSLWFNLEEWAIEHPDYMWTMRVNVDLLNDKSPMMLDITPDEPTSIDGTYSYCYPMPDYYMPDNKQSSSLEKFYRDAFVSIVTESRFAQNTGNYSEKMYQAVLHRKPFIMVAPPKTLEYIRQEGFMTFGDFWDESYDDCRNHQDRLILLFKLIDVIEATPLRELRQMYSEMAYILEHNYTTLLNKTPGRSVQLLEESI